MVLSYLVADRERRRREAVAAAGREALARNRGRPGKGGSLFAMVRLEPPPDRLGRPAAAGAGRTGWSLTGRHTVTGHFRLQAYGPGNALRRLLWIDAYERGPEDAPTPPRAERL